MAQYVYDELLSGNVTPLDERAAHCGGAAVFIGPVEVAIMTAIETTELRYGADFRYVLTETGRVERRDFGMFARFEVVVSDEAQQAGFPEGVLFGSQWIFIEDHWEVFCADRQARGLAGYARRFEMRR